MELSTKELSSLYKNCNVGDELELRLIRLLRDKSQFNILYSDFVRLTKYMGVKYDTPENIKNLDIIYSPENGIKYRVSINNNIDGYMSSIYNQENYNLFKILLNNKSSDIGVMKKVLKGNFTDIDNYFRLSLSSEETSLSSKDYDIMKNIDYINKDKVIIRLKDRLTYKIYEDENIKIVCDMTIVHSTYNFQDIMLNKINPTYEFEIELIKKKNTNNGLDILFSHYYDILKFIQGSKIVVSNTTKTRILQKYAELINAKLEKDIQLRGPNVVSLDIKNSIEKIPYKYNVTDKADGERAFLLIDNGNVYIIDNTLRVTQTDIVLDKPLAKKYQNTILDGEMVYIKSYNKYLYQAFDILISGDTNMLNTTSFMERYKKLMTTTNQAFDAMVMGDPVVNEYNQLLSFHDKQIDRYLESIHKRLSTSKTLLVVNNKYFCNPLGISTSEVWAYSNLIWSKFRTGEFGIPYNLDGLIYTPLDGIYLNKSNDYPIYKWKPDNMNSIDFYIEFQKDKNGVEEIFFDNTIEKSHFKIMNLYCGEKNGPRENYIPFMKSNDMHKGYILCDEDGNIFDIDGEIINDRSVVECVYRKDENKFNWSILRTRYDKTDMVSNYRRKYGNSIKIAEDIMKTIRYPLTINDIKLLSKSDTYDKHKHELLKRAHLEKDTVANIITEDSLTGDNQDIIVNKYYQKITDSADGMRAFHNWIKRNMIHIYCRPLIEKTLRKVDDIKKVNVNVIKRMDILDLGVGRGGDLPKYFGTGPNLVVGLDIDPITLRNDAEKRYNEMKSKTRGYVPNVVFFPSDSGLLFNVDIQNNVHNFLKGNRSTEYEKYFNYEDPYKFDVINCQFSLHYYLETQEKFNNFCENIKNHLKKGGIFLATCFDGEKVFKLLEKNSGYYMSKITSPDGRAIKFMEITKRYDDTSIKDITFGAKIDVYNSLISDTDVVNPEYLVIKEFLISYLEKHANLKLVEVNSFENMNNVFNSYFTNLEKYQEDDKVLRQLLKIKDFFASNSEIDNVSREFSFLNNFYVFRKIDEDEMKGGSTEPIITSYESTHIIPNMDYGNHINYNYNSIEIKLHGVSIKNSLLRSVLFSLGRTTNTNNIEQVIQKLNESALNMIKTKTLNTMFSGSLRKKMTVLRTRNIIKNNEEYGFIHTHFYSQLLETTLENGSKTDINIIIIDNINNFITKTNNNCLYNIVLFYNNQYYSVSHNDRFVLANNNPFIESLKYTEPREIMTYLLNKFKNISDDSLM